MSKSRKNHYRHHGYHYPTLDLVFEIHDAVLTETGGATGVLNIGVVESAVRKPIDSAGGYDAYPTFFTKVAAIGFTLAHDHGFKDANKRTALMTMLHILECNGYYTKPEPTQREQEMAPILAAMGHLKIEGLRIVLMMWCGIDPADTEA